MDTTIIIERIFQLANRVPDLTVIFNLLFITLEVIYFFRNQPVFFFFRGYQAANAFVQFLVFWAVHNSFMAYLYPWHTVPIIDVLCRFVSYYLGYFYMIRTELPYGNLNPPNNTGFLVGVETNPGPVFSKEANDQPNSSYEVDYESQSGWLPQLTMDELTRDSILGLSSSLSKAANAIKHANVTVNAPDISHLGDSLQSAAMDLSASEVDIRSTTTENIFKKIVDCVPNNEACHKMLIILATVVLTFQSHGGKNPVSKFLKMAVAGYAVYAFPKDLKLLACVGAIFATSAAYSAFENGRVGSGSTDDPETEPSYEAQVGGDVVGTVVSAIVGFIWYQSFSSDMSTKDIVKFIKTLGDLPKLSNGISFLIDAILSITQKFLTFCTDKFGMEEIRLKSSLFPELDALGTEYNNFVSSLRQGAPYNYDNAMRLFEIEQKVNNMVAKIPNSRDYVEYKKSALALAASIKPLVTRMERNNIVGNGPRREPLGIMLGGPTGVGKSTSIVPLILAVNALVMPEEKLDGFQKNHNDYIWNFIPENPFFDSYHGQFNTIIDEAGAQLDVAGNPDPGALGALRMINGANFPLHMANLEDKGNTNFNSELVFATTNRTYFQWNSMYCSEAYCRRFKLSYLVVPKLKYCIDEHPTDQDLWKRRLDLSKIPITESGFCPDVNEFFPYNFKKSSAGSYGSPLNFDEVIMKIADTYKAHKIHADSLLGFHSDIKSKYIAMRKGKMHAQSGDDELEFDDFAKEFYGFYPFPEDIVGSVYSDFKSKITRSFSCFKEFAEQCKERLLSALEPIGASWHLNLKKHLMNAKPFFYGLAAAIPIIGLIWKFLGPAIFSEQSGYTVKHKNVNVRPGKAKSSKELRRVYKTTNHEQAGVNQNCLDVANKLVNNNLYALDVVLHKGNERLGFVLFTHGRCAMFPEHFTHCIETFVNDGDCDVNPVLSFKRVGAIHTGFDVVWDDVSITYIEGVEDDVNYMVLPDVLPAQKDIRSYICDADEIKVKTKFEGALLRPIDCGFALVTATIFPVGNTSYSNFSMDKGFQYDIATKRGDCGAPLFLVGQKNKPVIVGLHVAGNGRNGMATSINRARVDEAFDTVPFVKVELDLEPQSKIKLGDNYLVGKEVLKLRSSFKTQVIKSGLHNAWGESDYAPALLRPITADGKIIDPWVNARSKYSRHSPAVNSYLLEAVCNETISDIIYESTDEDPWPHRKYEYEEAVAGIETVDYIDGIPRSTSPGYPYCIDNTGKGKSAWFGSEGPYSFDTGKARKLKEDVFVSISKLENLERMDTVFADYLKDQRVPKEKALIGKTRLISASSMDSLIIFKMYFGDLIRWLMQNRVRNSMSVGINAYSHEWTHVANRLQSVGTKCIFGDYSAYDGSLSPQFMYKFLDLADAFYSGGSRADRNVRFALFEDIVNSRHICSTEGPVSIEYEWFGSNPSGNLLTTLLNSFCNILIIKYSIANCWGKTNSICHLSMKDQEVDMIVSRIRDNVRCITFGDDNGICVSDEFSEFVDQQTISNAMSEIGFKYTDETKTENLVVTHRDIKNCTFLKRGFIMDERKLYSAPLEFAVIMEMCYWTKSNAPAGSLEQTVSIALMELSIHGRDVFDKYAPIIVEQCILKIQHRPNPSYSYNLNKARHHEGYY